MKIDTVVEQYLNESFKVLPPLNDRAVHWLDKFIVIQKREGDVWRAIEGHFNKSKAEHVKKVLDDHDRIVSKIITMEEYQKSLVK